MATNSAEMPIDRAPSKSIEYILYLGWFVAALFYCFQYVLRVAPGVLVIDLRHDFNLTAEQFSTLGAFYLYAYSLAQIPAGILLDSVGVRKTIITSILLCLIGTLLFSFAHSLLLLQISRIIVGIGSACAFMSALKIVVEYLPAGKRGFLMGATLTLGTIGALFAGKPLVLLSHYFGWRLSLNYINAFGLFILFIAFYFLPQAQQKFLIPISKELPNKIISALSTNLKSRPIIIYAFLAIAVYTPLSVLADLWGVAFLMQKYNLVQAEAAHLCMMMYLGLGIGCLLLPFLSEKYNFLNRTILISSFGVLASFSLLTYGPLLSHAYLALSLLFLGVFCGAEMLCFTGASNYTSVKNIGITFGLVNTLNMLGGGMLQHGIGFILDKIWNGQVDPFGLRLYTTANYTTALSALTLIIFICCVLAFFLPKDKNKTN